MKQILLISGPNLNLLGKFYEDMDPLGVLGLPNNLIQIIGNKNTLLYESRLEFSADGIRLMVAGGILYTLGTVFYARDKMKYNHVIWHVFVMAGSACHYFMILGII